MNNHYKTSFQMDSEYPPLKNEESNPNLPCVMQSRRDSYFQRESSSYRYPEYPSTSTEQEYNPYVSSDAHSNRNKHNELRNSSHEYPDNHHSSLDVEYNPYISNTRHFEDKSVKVRNSLRMDSGYPSSSTQNRFNPYLPNERHVRRHEEHRNSFQREFEYPSTDQQDNPYISNSRQLDDELVRSDVSGASFGDDFPEHGNYHDPELQCDESTSQEFIHEATPNIGKKRLNCHLCSESFIKNKTFTKHLRDHKTGRLIRCEVCGKKCKNQLDLIKHNKTKHIYSRNKAYKYLPKEEASRSLYFCKICRDKFYDMKELKSHENDKHSDQNH